ncbi:TOM1-like protein 2 isoform X5 [Enoplosus armatus]|uniref:TOM1-like protein 2 isoform X5 n=1 Tax=Enoplosus armatus TaxID=215367 RepID=UPI003994103F
MEFLLGNPYSTPVGQCIERATDGGLQNEDWTLNMEICDIINETDEGPKDAMRALKKRLSGNKNYREVMLALTAWADAFRSSPDLTGVVHIYEELKRKGIEFPMADLDALSPIHTPQRGTPEVDPAMIKYLAPASPAAGTPAPSPSPTAATATPAPNMPSPITATPEQIARLRSELDIVRGNTKVMSEMLTEMVPGQEDASDLELLQELNRTCRAMQQRVVELISRVSNEEVTEELLHVNDDLNNIFLRYERYERYRSGRAAQNNGMLNEATEDNLIDLGPGSPAVVTPRITSSPPLHSPARASASPAHNPTTAALSSALAGLDVASDSVSGTLSSLSGPNQDDFDMFAQTRSSSLAEQRKNVKYEDPQALGSLASALDVRQQNAGGIPVSQSSVMDDIEEWLCADVKGDAAEEGVTSEEFDKFLEERAKAVDSLPSPPEANPAHPARAPGGSHKKAERTEDALFAL